MAEIIDFKSREVKSTDPQIEQSASIGLTIVCECGHASFELATSGIICCSRCRRILNAKWQWNHAK